METLIMITVADVYQVHSLVAIAYDYHTLQHAVTHCDMLQHLLHHHL